MAGMLGLWGIESVCFHELSKRSKTDGLPKWWLQRIIIKYPSSWLGNWLAREGWPKVGLKSMTFPFFRGHRAVMASPLSYTNQEPAPLTSMPVNTAAKPCRLLCQGWPPIPAKHQQTHTNYDPTTTAFIPHKGYPEGTWLRYVCATGCHRTLST